MCREVGRRIFSKYVDFEISPICEKSKLSHEGSNVSTELRMLIPTLLSHTTWTDYDYEINLRRNNILNIVSSTPVNMDCVWGLWWLPLWCTIHIVKTQGREVLATVNPIDPSQSPKKGRRWDTFTYNEMKRQTSENSTLPFGAYFTLVMKPGQASINDRQ